jgi:hypothetical protein
MTQHFFGHSSVKGRRYPLYFPDLSPLNFHLFGKVKSGLMGREIPDKINLLEAATEILNGISNAELQHLFRSWIEQTETVIEEGGDYLTSQIFSSPLSHSRSTPLWSVSSFTEHSTNPSAASFRSSGYLNAGDCIAIKKPKYLSPDTNIDCRNARYITLIQ